MLNKHKVNNRFNRFIWLVLNWMGRVPELRVAANWRAVAISQSGDVAKIGGKLTSDLRHALSSMTKAPFIALQRSPMGVTEKTRLQTPATALDSSSNWGFIDHACETYQVRTESALMYIKLSRTKQMTGG